MFMKHVGKTVLRGTIYKVLQLLYHVSHYPTEVEGRCLCQQKKTPRVIGLPIPFPVKTVISNPLPKCVQISSPQQSMFSKIGMVDCKYLNDTEKHEQVARMDVTEYIM